MSSLECQHAVSVPGSGPEMASPASSALKGSRMKTFRSLDNFCASRPNRSRIGSPPEGNRHLSADYARGSPRLPRRERIPDRTRRDARNAVCRGTVGVGSVRRSGGPLLLGAPDRYHGAFKCRLPDRSLRDQARPDAAAPRPRLRPDLPKCGLTPRIGYHSKQYVGVKNQPHSDRLNLPMIRVRPRSDSTSAVSHSAICLSL